MRNAMWLMLGVLVIGCGDSTPVEDVVTTTTYKADFSTQFVENAVYIGTVRLDCATTYNMTGTVSVVLKTVGPGAPTGDGLVVANHTLVSVAGKDCKAGPDRTTGASGWGTDATPTGTDVAFTVSRESATAFNFITTYTFTGVLTGNTIPGTLTMSNVGSGVTGGTVASTAVAHASVNMTLR